MVMDKDKFMEKTEETPLYDNNHKPLTKKMTITEKIYYIIKNVTVEPLLAAFIISGIISKFAMINLNFDKACRVNLKFSEDVCDALIRKDSNNYTSYEEEVQKLMAAIDIWKNVIYTSLPCILILFLGSWSDRTGKRKLCIFVPLCGEILSSINQIINVYFFYEIPVQFAVLSETLIVAISGGWLMMLLGAFSYISDITSHESRTFRVGLLNLCFTTGLPIGIALSGILVQKMGYYGIFSTTGVTFTIVFVYGFFCLKEPDEFLKTKGLPPIERPNNDSVSFFDTTHVIDTIAVAFRKRSNGRRSTVILTLLIVFVLFGPSMSEHHIFYMFVRNRLNWDMVKYSIYNSYSSTLHSLGTIFSVSVLSRKLQMDDALLCLISVSSKFIGLIWTAFVKTDVEMYLIPVIEILNGTTLTSLRSILTKLVEKHEIAKVNSLFSLTETLTALTFSSFYSWLYMVTLQTLSGAVFLASAGLIIPASCILIFFIIQNRKRMHDVRKNALKTEEEAAEKDMKTPPSSQKLK